MIPSRDNPDFGNQLKRHRERAEMTRSELAKEVGCSDSYISMLERSKCKPGPDVYSELVKIFNEPKPVLDPATRAPTFLQRAKDAERVRELERTVHEAHERSAIATERAERQREVDALQTLTVKASEALSLETLIRMIHEKGYTVTVTKLHN